MSYWHWVSHSGPRASNDSKNYPVVKLQLALGNISVRVFFFQKNIFP